MTERAIAVQGLRKVFGVGETKFEALRGIDLEVQVGEFLILAGPSGSGKTTLLSILGCVLAPSAGSVRLMGEELFGKTESGLQRLRRSVVGTVFQNGNLIASLTTLQNVELVLGLRGWPPRDARAEATRLLGLVGLSGKEREKPWSLSGGQRQRVGIARALAASPPIVLADEPTASLDAPTGQRIMELLRELATTHRHTVVVVTHDSRIFHLADRIAHIADGRILHFGTEKAHETS